MILLRRLQFVVAGAMATTIGLVGAQSPYSSSLGQRVATVHESRAAAIHGTKMEQHCCCARLQQPFMVPINKATLGKIIGEYDEIERERLRWPSNGRLCV